MTPLFQVERVDPYRSTRNGTAYLPRELPKLFTRTMTALDNSGHWLDQEFVDEGRFEIARQLLQDSAMDVRQIAVSLEYADANA
jgi:hypothetical protein